MVRQFFSTAFPRGERRVLKQIEVRWTSVVVQGIDHESFFGGSSYDSDWETQGDRTRYQLHFELVGLLTTTEL